MNTVPVIDVQNLSVDYRLPKGWANALYDVSLTVRSGEVHGLVGESGSGKSTLALAAMRYLAANARVSSGRILFEGANLLSYSDDEIRRVWGRQISLVPQDPLASLNPAYRVGDQIAEIFRTHEHLSRSAAAESAIEMLRRVKINDAVSVAKRYPHQLSGGMQQRVTIAMALSTRPRLLVLDEPTTNLDVTTQASILDLFRELIAQENAAVLYVSHDLGIIAQLCDTVTVLYGGEVMTSGPVDAVYAHPVHPYTIGLLSSLPRPTEGIETRLRTIEGAAPSLADRPHACVFSPRCPVALDLCRQEKPLLEVGLEGRLLRCHRWREIAGGTLLLETEPVQAAAHAETFTERAVLKVSALSKRFTQGGLLAKIGGRQQQLVAVDDVSLMISRQSTLGLVGESGSGKTTLARCIVGLHAPDSGAMELLEMSIMTDVSKRPREALRELQMVFQNPNDALNPYHTIGQALERTIYTLADEPMTAAQRRDRVDALLEVVRLPVSFVHRYPGELSGGEKQRVAIARAFAANPALVVADEPVSALDVSVRAVILNLLKDLRAQRGASYLLISHDMSAVAYLADTIAVMYLGQIVEYGTSEQVYGVPSHPYTEALLSAIPIPDPRAKQGRIRLDGDLPDPSNLPHGCRFHTRCPRKIGVICEQQPPPWQESTGGHGVRCHISLDELAVLQVEDVEQRSQL